MTLYDSNGIVKSFLAKRMLVSLCLLINSAAVIVILHPVLNEVCEVT